jgi:transcriptional regulator with XRE-family HTH domain
MKVSQNRMLPPNLLAEASLLGARLARLRIARRITQAEAAVRAGLSRNTAYRLEKGDAGVAVGQILRYLDAIAPRKTLLGLLQEDDPALLSLSASEQRQRVRELSKQELAKLDF